MKDYFSGLLLLAGTAGFEWCFFTHICMAGHMCHDHQVEPWHHGVETAWVGAWIVGAVLAINMNCEKPRRLWILPLVLGLLYFRFGLGSMGGLVPGI